MNVFASDPCPEWAAILLPDQHVRMSVKMTAQILSTVAHNDGIEFEGQYRATHRNNPVIAHCARDAGYLAWICYHGWHLCGEYAHRTGKDHASAVVIAAAIEAIWGGFDSIPDPTPRTWAVIVAPSLLVADPHESYRAHLMAKWDQWAKVGRAATWTNAEAPQWYVKTV